MIAVIAPAVSQHLRHAQNRRSKDDRHNAAGVYLQRQMGRLSAHDFTPDNALRILHRNTALAALYIDDEGDDDHHQRNQQDHRRSGKRSPRIGSNFVVEINHAARQADHNTGENQQRHAVANTAFGNLLAQPHDEHAARSQSQHGHQDEAHAGINHEITLLLQAERDTKRLDGAEDNSQVARPLGDFLAPQFAFFLQFCQRLINHGQQLQNDGGGDVGHDAQRENGQDGAAGRRKTGQRSRGSCRGSVRKNAASLSAFTPGVGM